ncbi:MAG: putative toxin-antitoxin system toxin component, PIN family [Rhodocyclaceae bacterium]|nr:putative toxin-antitoxin system toxin component, PIN family [Rhodocyclaceae bacterium]
MKRRVLDTGVLVAGLRSPTGASAEILRRIHGRRFVMLASVALFLEYETVLTRSEHLRALQLSGARMRRLLDELAEMVMPVESWFQWRPQLRDPADEMVLEAAVNGRSDVLISFNSRDFSNAPSHFGIELATPGQFLRSLQKWLPRPAIHSDCRSP